MRRYALVEWIVLVTQTIPNEAQRPPTGSPVSTGLRRLIQRDREKAWRAHPHARMFVLSHVYGPPIGLVLAAFLALLGFPLDYRLIVFTSLVCLFWGYPVALRRSAGYRALSLASLQHLTLVILWASHGYGGLASPFLLWLAMVPLLAFLYLVPSRRLWWALTTMLALNVAAFVGWSVFASPPPAVSPAALSWLAASSLICASVYVAMMALHFGRVLSSRNAMELEAARHRAEVTGLEQRRAHLQRIGAAKAASLARVGRECRAPVSEILSRCQGGVTAETGIAIEYGESELRSIEEASRHLRDLIEIIDQHSRLDARFGESTSDPFSLDQLFDAVVAKTGTVATPGRCVKAQCPAEPILLCTDRALLELALVELVRYTQSIEGPFCIALSGSSSPRTAPESAIVAIVIKSEFTRLDPSRSTDPIGEGRGQYVHRLGVGLAERICALLGGRLVEEACTTGARFRMCFP